MTAEAKEHELEDLRLAQRALERVFMEVEPLEILLYPFGCGARKQLANPVAHPEWTQGWGIPAHLRNVRSTAEKAYRQLSEDRERLFEHDGDPTAKVGVRILDRMIPAVLGLWCATHLASEGYAVTPVSEDEEESWVEAVDVFRDAVHDMLRDARELDRELKDEAA